MKPVLEGPDLKVLQIVHVYGDAVPGGQIRKVGLCFFLKIVIWKSRNKDIDDA